ncbi:MAG: histidinol-phosphatase, partial [Alphaproteobacteria bacterium]|nr:histidinol-phosphatase [Alphaproteobacteria bacterium]
MSPGPRPADFVALAHRLADAAGAAIRPHFRADVAVTDKDDSSPVTVADHAAEAAMRRILAAACPDHGIHGEEMGVERLDAEWVWVLDPIDGTKAFISGLPLFGTLIALCRHGRPVLGAIDQPILRERWIGAEGMPTTLNGNPAKVRACSGLARATLFTTAPDMMDGPATSPYERLRQAVKLSRFGGDCYAYAMLASGHIDLVVERKLKPFDYCALAPVIEQAGGVITDWLGKALTVASDGQVVAAG